MHFQETFWGPRGRAGLKRELPRVSPRLHPPEPRGKDQGASSALAPAGWEAKTLALFIVWAGRSQAERSRCSWGELILAVACSGTEIRSRRVWRKIPPHLLTELEMHAGSYQQSVPPPSPGEAVRSVPCDSASLRQEAAVSFLSIWQHQTHVLLQGAKQAWRCPRKPLGARLGRGESTSGRV